MIALRASMPLSAMTPRRPLSPPLAAIAAVALGACTGGCEGTHRVASSDGGQADHGSNGGGAGAGGSGGGGGGSSFGPDDPKTCDLAAVSRSYVGCDFWPTPLWNPVDKHFDFAAVVANAGTEPADVMVTGPGGTSLSDTVPPKEVRKLYLPWVPELQPTAPMTSVQVKNGAFHLTSTRPITAYQFNPLEYAAKGGPAGKDWTGCLDPASPPPACLSHTNDASLLIPSTAMTGHYRITGYPADQDLAGYFGVTGIADGTEVTVTLSAGGDVVGGGGVPASAGGSTFKLTLDAGEVAEVVGGYASDLGGTLVTSDKPVQVIAGHLCAVMPPGFGDCDHLEETVMPIETLGTKYHVTVPTGPDAVPVAHVVRLFGNADGTALSYAPTAPAGAPDTLDAGQVADLGAVKEDFEVRGSKAFAVASFQVGSGYLYPGSYAMGMPNEGDPSQTTFAAVEQYRRAFVFLAPDDYDLSFADVTTQVDAMLELDGVPVSTAAVPIGDTGYGVFRLPLGGGSPGGGHVLSSSAPAGLQVIGYGMTTSYQFPGGLNLRRITTAP